MSATASAEPQSGGPHRFASLRNRNSGPYIVGAALSMMADNVEHVLGYWVLWQMFHSPWLVGFQIVSHWLPFLLFSVTAGALAERFDCRRIIQISQGLFISVSLAWGVLFLTGTLELWHACVLLVIHGIAGCLWMPAEQLMLYDFVGEAELPGAIRMNATFRSLAFLVGPVVGSALLLGVGPAIGMFVNAVFYIPLTVFLALVRLNGHTRTQSRVKALTEAGELLGSSKPRTPLSLRAALRALNTVRGDRQLLAMMLLATLSAVTLGAVIQNAMPEFAEDFDTGSAGLAYGVLLFANGAGGVLGGVLIEAIGTVPTTATTAVGSAILLGLSTVVFALTGNFVLSVVALLIGGIARITSEATEMSIVQLRAPDAERGRVIGAYSMFGPGMMTFSGITVALFGSLFGLRGSVLFGGIVLTIGAILVGLLLIWRPHRRSHTV